MNDDEWARLCDGVNRLGKVAKDMGIALTYHHHMGTVVQTAAEIDRLTLWMIVLQTSRWRSCRELWKNIRIERG